MGGFADSAGGFLGLSDGPQISAKTGNPFLSSAINANRLYEDNNPESPLFNASQSGLYNGDMSNEQALSGLGRMNQAGMMQGQNELATGITGSKFASNEIQNNPMFSSLFGKNGLMQNEANNLNNQVNQGWSLQPEDQTMYGQAAGQIARQYGQQGNDLASSLASRGLSNSGAAGAQFSGLAGNQNEQLANAQTNIMQQRFQNTMNQMNQMNQLAGTAGNLVNQQYGRQLSGANSQQQNRQSLINATTSSNAAENAANMNASEFNAANKPKNAMDFFTSGLGQGIQSQTSDAVSGNTGKQMASGAASSGGGGGGGGMGMMAMMSDKRLKTNIGKADDDLYDMLSNLEPVSFEYSHDQLPKGMKYGVMAQDLEKSKAGKTAIREVALGKGVDLHAGMSLILSSLAHIHKRLANLEGASRGN